MNVKALIVLAFIALFSCCGPDPVIKDESASAVISQGSNTEEKPSGDKSDEELIKEVVEGAVGLTNGLIRQHNIRDSARFANREQMFGYRIGFPIKDYDEVFEVYKRLGLSDNVYALKQSRKEYYLFYCPGGSEQELKDSLESFRLDLPDEFKNNVHVKNMTELCTNSKQKLMLGENLTKRKEEIVIPCLVCDK